MRKRIGKIKEQDKKLLSVENCTKNVCICYSRFQNFRIRMTDFCGPGPDPDHNKFNLIWETNLRAYSVWRFFFLILTARLVVRHRCLEWSLRRNYFNVLSNAVHLALAHFVVQITNPSLASIVSGSAKSLSSHIGLYPIKCVGVYSI